ncbi:translational activator of cytochrome c oxidase 1 isoform X1 [Cataglyphis hispanica]|uniref:translational activator of cytochrome c oxidase 1 isoform X1 n=2 Tax=Cataglyphis hispanica TaxID=1086592 RepID=UPI00218005BC|nr:translational activator of cytochrome c oxidase 1 isoform X1 [Cataglyphis hispanica]
MTEILNKLLFNRYIYFLSKGNRRYAGHSKWANIKHIKEEKDNERMILFQQLKHQMEVAIQETGNTKPNNNIKLAQIIEQAKKANMPVTSINKFLEKMEARKNKTQTGIIEVRGPNGYVMLVRYTTDNAKSFILQFKSKIKKTSGKIAEDSAKQMFTHVGNIIVEKKGDLEHAMEDAINIGAEDVEEFEKNNTKYFQFKCDPKLLNKIQNLLQGLQYSVLSVEEDYIPHSIIKLNDSDLKVVSQIHNKILSLEDVSHIYDNTE